MQAHDSPVNFANVQQHLIYRKPLVAASLSKNIKGRERLRGVVRTLNQF